MPHKLIFPEVSYNPDGWGPKVTSDKFKDIPYQPFSKADRVGKIADWMGLLYQDKKYTNKYTSQYGTGTQYAYFHEEEESGFQIVDTSKITRPAYQRGGKFRFNQRNFKPQYNNKNQMRGNMGHQNKNSRQMQQNQNKSGGGGGNRAGNMPMGGYQRFRFATKSAVPVKIHRESSIRIKSEWQVVEELDFLSLNKLSLPNIDKPVDLKTYGSVEFYDKSYDRCTTKNSKSLIRTTRILPQVTTTDDPIIRQLAKTEGNVYFTDTILATLMCTTKSVYSWDIIVEKYMNKLFFDKRDVPEVDLVAVSETSVEPPPDDPDNMNSVKNLAMEATFINHNFSQQVLKGEDKFKGDLPNPFEGASEEGEMAPKLYRYRKWDLGNSVMLVARTEVDAVQMGAESNEPQLLTIKSLNEWDSRYSNGMDWRGKLDTQRTSVLANELKNNSCKLAKWTAASILAGADLIKLGYISRAHPLDSTKHVILGVQQFRPLEFAQNINLQLVNAWGIVRYIVDRIMKMPDGKFVIMKDPNKQCLRIYSVPIDAFSSSEESDDAEEGGEDDDGDEENVENERIEENENQIEDALINDIEGMNIQVNGVELEVVNEENSDIAIDNHKEITVADLEDKDMSVAKTI